MKKSFAVITGIAFGLSLVFLAACGGGGGGGFTPIAYTGATSQATIDDTNAADFAALAESGVFMVGAAPIPLSVTPGPTAGPDIPVPVLSSIFELNKTLPGYLDGTASGNGVAAVSQTLTEYCGIGDGSDGSITYTESISGSSGTATISFNACDQGVGVVLNGVISLSSNNIFADPYVTPMTINITYRNLEMTFTDVGESVTIYASMAMTEDLTGTDPVYTQNIIDLIMEDGTTGLTARISNYKIILTEVSDPVTGFYDHDELVIASASVKARVYDHDLGYVEFYTVTPIKDDGFGPYEGIVHLDGANGSWAEIDFSGLPCDGVSTFNGTFDNGAGTSGQFCYMPAP